VGAVIVFILFGWFVYTILCCIYHIGSLSPTISGYLELCAISRVYKLANNNSITVLKWCKSLTVERNRLYGRKSLIP